MFWSPNFQIKTFPVQSIALTLTFTVNTIQGQFWPFGTVCGLFWDQSNVKQAGAELGQAQPKLGPKVWVCILGWRLKHEVDF